MNIDLKDKIALVVGSSGEQSIAICKQLSLSGAKVVTDAPDNTSASQLQESLQAEGFDIHVYAADITDFDSCGALVNAIEQEIGPIDIIVNSMDWSEEVLFKDMEKQQWDQALTINLDALFNLCKQVAAGMGERGFGRIVNISSIVSRMGQINNATHYATAKAGVHGFTMALAQELARKGVTVNTVSPGQIAIDNLEELPEELRNEKIKKIPAARFGKADEVAYLVDFLCSEQAGFINGTDIAINGGQYMH